MTKMYSRYTSLICFLFSCCYSNCVQAQDSAYEQPIKISFCENKIGAINFSRAQTEVNLQRDFNSIDELSANNLMRNVCYSEVKCHIFSSILNKTQRDDAYIDSLINCILTLQKSYDICTNKILNQYLIRTLSSIKSQERYAEATFLSSIEVQYLLSLKKSTELQKRFYFNTDEYSQSYNGSKVQWEQDLSRTKMYIDNILPDMLRTLSSIKSQERYAEATFLSSIEVQHLLSLKASTELQKRFYFNTDEYYQSYNGSKVQWEQDLSRTKMYIDNILPDMLRLEGEIYKLNISMNADFDRLRNLAFKQKRYSN